MKATRILLFCIPALLLAGCTSNLMEPEVEVSPEPIQKKVVITARFGDSATRVSYYEDRSEDSQKPILHQQWDLGDWVYGFDDAGHALYLQVTDIMEENGERIAVMAPEDCSFPDDGYIHLFYLGKPDEGGMPEAVWLYELQHNNHVAFYSFEDRYSPFTYSEDPDSENNVAGIMTADAAVLSSVSDGVLTLRADLVFENQMAIIGIEGIQVDPGARIDRIEISGVRTDAVFSVEMIGGEPHLVFDAGTFTADQTIAVDLTDYPKAREDGKILFNGPLFIAVYPREGGDGTEDIVLRARVETDDETDFYYYTCNLGPKIIERGKYYYIPTKQFDAPVIPVVRVETYVATEENEVGEWVQQVYSSFNEAMAFVNTEAATDVDMYLLCNHTVQDLDALTGSYNGQYINLYLLGHALTLDGCPLSIGGPVSFTIWGDTDAVGRIIQSSNEPVASVSEGAVFINEGVSIVNQGTASPFQVSGTGAVTIWGGRFSWKADTFINSASTEDSYIMGGRYSKQPVSSGQVVFGSDPEDEPWGSYPDGDPFQNEEEGDPYCPYVLLPASLYNNLAHTSSGVLEVFSINRWEKVYLAQNNLCVDENNDWAFDAPNWEGNAAFSSVTPNLFEYSNLQEYYSIDELLLNPVSCYDWDNIWNRYSSAFSFVKCSVVDNDGKAWHNILVFPDGFTTWPDGIDPVAETILNNPNQPWEDEDAPAPAFTITGAQAFLNAGCVFLPASGYVYYDEANQCYVTQSENEGGYYWSPVDQGRYLCFDDGNLYNHQADGAQYGGTFYAVRLAYPCQ